MTYTFFSTENPYVASVSPVELSVIEDSSVTLEFQIAVNSDGNTWDNEDVYFSFISGVDAEVSVPFSVRGPEFPQNYIYSIQQVDRSQEGQYFAFAPRTYMYIFCRHEALIIYFILYIHSVTSDSMSTFPCTITFSVFF